MLINEILFFRMKYVLLELIGMTFVKVQMLSRWRSLTQLAPVEIMPQPLLLFLHVLMSLPLLRIMEFPPTSTSGIT